MSMTVRRLGTTSHQLLLFLFVWIALCGSSPVAGQMADGAVAAKRGSGDYARAERFLSWNANKLVYNHPVTPNWIEQSDRFWYRKRVPAGHEFVYVDPDLNVQRPAFDHEKLSAALSTLSGRAYEPYRLPFRSIELLDWQPGDEQPGVEVPSVRFWETLKPAERDGGSNDEESTSGESTDEETESQEATAEDSGDTKAEAEVPQRRFTCRLDTYECVGPEDIEKKTDDLVESPDKQWYAFERDENLWLRNVASGDERQLTEDGEEDYGYGVIGEGCCSEISSRRSSAKRKPPIYWSPDSRKIATLRLDERQVEELHLLEAKVGRPVLHSYRYALPGDEHIPTYKVHVFDLDSGRSVEVESPPIELHWPGEEDLRFSEDSSWLYFMRMHRGYQQADLYRAQVSSGESRIVLSETSRTFIENNMTFADKADWRVTKDGTRVVWRSERDGWGHFYLFDATTGELLNRVTRGAYTTGPIHHLAAAEGNRPEWLYFSAYGLDGADVPYQEQFYRVRLDGSGLTRLSEEDGAHTIAAPRSGRYFVDSYSDRAKPPVTVLRKSDGTVVRTLEMVDASALFAAGWKPPETFRVKARDGVTDIWGQLYRPSFYDREQHSEMSFPVVDYIYPGPQIGSVRTWGFTVNPSGQAQALAELGFIVVQIDALGTPFRSKAFHDAWYGDMADNGLLDHIHAIKQLAARYHEIDLERVGIYGHSGGGFSSTGAILRHPEFFDVAVSGAGNHDQRSYSFGWGEKYQGLLEKKGSGDNYESQANHLLADQLEGKLLLTYGTLDDNVHPNATELLIEALIENNKDFDLLVLPKRNHGYASEPYLLRRTWDYFVRHLRGEAPPREYEIAPRPDE